MVSSKGKPTDPKLREEVKEKVKNETNKDGSGKGQMAAWKVSLACASISGNRATRQSHASNHAPLTRL
jgi:hypothetical protein